MTGSRLSAVPASPRLAANGQWMIPSFTGRVVNVHHASRNFSAVSRGMKMEFSILVSFQGQIGYWSPSLCLLRSDSCMPEPVAALTAAHSSGLIDALWAAVKVAGETGRGWLSEVAIQHRCRWLTLSFGRDSANPFRLVWLLITGALHDPPRWEGKWGKSGEKGWSIHPGPCRNQYRQRGMMRISPDRRRSEEKQILRLRAPVTVDCSLLREVFCKASWPLLIWIGLIFSQFSVLLSVPAEIVKFGTAFKRALVPKWPTVGLMAERSLQNCLNETQRCNIRTSVFVRILVILQVKLKINTELNQEPRPRPACRSRRTLTEMSKETEQPFGKG